MHWLYFCGIIQENCKGGESMARPRIEIDKEQFEKLCDIQCTITEIAGWFKCAPDTIENWCKRTYGETFSETFKKYSSGGKISLRRTQFRLAEKNTAMAIWLGKQYLGQREVIDVDNTSNGQLEEILTYMKKGRKNV